MTSCHTHFEFLQFDSLEQSFRSSLLWRMLVCLLVHLSIFVVLVLTLTQWVTDRFFGLRPRSLSRPRLRRGDLVW